MAIWLGAAIARTLRRGHGLAQATLAERLGVNNSYVARIEAGNRHPSADLMARWVAACPCPVLPIAVLVADVAALDAGLDASGDRATSPGRQYALTVALTQSVETPKWLPPPQWPETAVTLRFPAATSLWDGAMETAQALAWMALRAATYADAAAQAREQIWHFRDDSTTAPAAWNRILQAVAALPLAEVSAAPDPEWAALGQVWSGLSVPARQALLTVARQLARP